MTDGTPYYGPAMAELTEKQQAYVLAMLADPFGNPTSWARAAGYSDVKEGAKVRGHYLSHDKRIEAAVQEVARAHLHTYGPLLGIAVAMRIARDESHPKQLMAAQALLNRTGFHETSEHRVTMEHTDRTGAAMARRIRELAEALGLDPAKLLGANAGPEPMKVIEGQVADAAGAE